MRIRWNTGNPPEEIEYYLVTTTNGYLEIYKWTNESYFGRGTTDWHWITDPYTKVTAWMPLPMPYNALSIKKDE